MSELRFGGLSALNIGPEDSVDVSVLPLNGGETVLSVHLSPNYALLGHEALIISPGVSGMTVYRNPRSGSLVLVCGRRNEQKISLEYGEAGDEATTIELEQLAVCGFR